MKTLYSQNPWINNSHAYKTTQLSVDEITLGLNNFDIYISDTYS